MAESGSGESADSRNPLTDSNDERCAARTLSSLNRMIVAYTSSHFSALLPRSRWARETRLEHQVVALTDRKTRIIESE